MMDHKSAPAGLAISLVMLLITIALNLYTRSLSPKMVNITLIDQYSWLLVVFNSLIVLTNMYATNVSA